MVKRPIGSGGEPSSPNCGVSAGVKARHPILLHFRRDVTLFRLAVLEESAASRLTSQRNENRIAFLIATAPIQHALAAIRLPIQAAPVALP